MKYYDLTFHYDTKTFYNAQKQEQQTKLENETV